MNRGLRRRGKGWKVGRGMGKIGRLEGWKGEEVFGVIRWIGWNVSNPLKEEAQSRMNVLQMQ